MADWHDPLLADESATEALGRRLAALLRPGDLVALRGDLGAGKTRFARAVIGALAGSDEEVPSPTFTLVQTYLTPAGVVWHLDLYRLAVPEEAYELGIEEAFAEAIALVEWPDRLGPLLPAERLDLTLALVPGRPEQRRARLQGGGTWARRLDALMAGA